MRLLLIFLLAFLPAPSLAEKLDFLLASPEQEAELLINDKNWARLDDFGKEAVADNPHSWRGWYYRARAKEGLNDAKAAANYFSRAEYLLPQEGEDAKRRAELLFRAAEANKEIGNWEEAEAAYRIVLREQPEQPALWGRLRDVLVEQEGDGKRAEEAEVLAEMLAFAEYANHYELWRRRADLLAAMEQNGEARIAYGEALRLRPSDLTAAEWAFRYDVAAGDKAAADAGATVLLALNDRHPLAHIYLADAAAAKGRNRTARKHYHIAAHGGDYPRARARGYSGLGELHGGQNNDRALENFLAALDADPSYLPAWEGAVITLRNLNKTRKARKYFSRQQLVKRLIESGKPVTRELLDDLD